jgi:hypothetical protein
MWMGAPTEWFGEEVPTMGEVEQITSSILHDGIDDLAEKISARGSFVANEYCFNPLARGLRHRPPPKPIQVLPSVRAKKPTWGEVMDRDCRPGRIVKVRAAVDLESQSERIIEKLKLALNGMDTPFGPIEMRG